MSVDHIDELMAKIRVNSGAAAKGKQGKEGAIPAATKTTVKDVFELEDILIAVANYGGERDKRRNKNALTGRYTAEAIANRREIATLLRAMKILARATDQSD
jgi:hypothetical protein